MVQPLIEFIVAKEGQPFLIFVTAILHFISAHYFDSHSFFMLMWTAISTRLYLSYIGVNLAEKIVAGFDMILERISRILSRNLTQVVQDVSSGLQEAGATLTGTSGFSSIAHEFSKHKIGLGACASTLSKATNVTEVLEEAVKVSSLLGLETSIVNSTIGRISTMAGQAIDPMVQHGGLEEMEKFIPLIASTAAFADVEFGDIQIGKHMDRCARNIKSAEVIAQHVRSIAESTGLCKSANWQIIQDLNEMVNELKEDHIWICHTLALQGSLFVKPENYDRVLKYRERVKNASQVLRNINIPAIKNNQIVTECNHILMKAQDYINQIEIIRKSIGIRPKPVGVCIYGDSHIGKTEVVDQLVQRVKKRLAERPELFGDAMGWAKWDANQREEFDSGYHGQEIVYMDDAFQDKQNKDHLMWYTYISSSCVGTIQGIAEQKGLPFRGLLCITTCNELPTKSIAVNHIAALHNRFPLTYHFKKVGPFQKWDEGGRDFPHLNIRHGTMSEFVANTRTRTDAIGNTVTSDGDFPECNLEGMVDQVVNEMIREMTFYNLKMSTTMALPFEPHGDSDEEPDQTSEHLLNALMGSCSEGSEEIDNDNSSEFLDEVLGQIPDTTHSLSPRTVTFNDQVEEVTIDQVLIEEEPADLVRLDSTITAGTSNDHLSTDQRRRAVQIHRIARAVAEDMANALARIEIDTVDSLDNWVTFLRDSNNRPVDLSNFRESDGLYSFLSALGAYHVPASRMEDFKSEFIQQRILKCADHLDTEYLWGPAFHMGTVLYLVSPDLKVALDNAFLNPWRRRAQHWARRLYRFIIDPHNHRNFAASVVPIAEQHLFPIEWLMNPFYSSALFLRSFTRVRYRHGVRPFWASEFSFRGVVYTTISSVEAPMWLAAKAFEYIETISLRLSRHMMGLMLQLLEYFGVDVSGYWQTIASISEHMLSEVITLGVSGLLIYIVYKLFKMLFSKKEDPIEMHESKNEFGKGKRIQRQKKEKQRTLQVRAFQPRSSEEFACETECKNEDFQVEIENKVYTKVGACNDKTSFYSTKTLDYCFGQLDICPETIYCDFLKSKNCHIVASSSDYDDFVLEKSELISLKRVTVLVNKTEGCGVEIRFNLVGNEDTVRQQFTEFVERLKHLIICDWQGEIICRVIEDVYHFKINLVGLTTTIQGLPRGFVRRELANLNKIAEDVKGLKVMTSIIAEEVFTQHGADESISLMNYLVGRHQVFISIADINNIDSDEIRKFAYGLGHLDIILFTAHLYEVGDFVRFWRWNSRHSVQGYQICVVEQVDNVRDLGIARIISKERFRAALLSKGIRATCRLMAPMQDRFRSLEPHLCDDATWRELTDEQSCLVFLPSSGSMSMGRVSVDGHVNRLTRLSDNTLVSKPTNFIKLSALNLNVALARKGDCGGIIMSCKDRYQSKVIGYHCGGNAANWYGTILRKEDIAMFVPHSSEDDLFRKLIVSGKPTDLPNGPECTFIGKYAFKTKPAGDKSLIHWRYSPFFEEFEEQLQPGPLDGNDPRIKIELPRNGIGEKSLLLIPNSVMCSSLPSMDAQVLKICIEDLTSEMSHKIDFIRKTPDDMEKLLEIGLNGDRENIFCTGMELDKACGLPWNELPGCTKKNHFLQNDDGWISFREDINGARLKTRVKRKLTSARRGERIISLSNSKLKDALIKLSAVENAKTRVFHCIPVDKVICDAALFGNFKEAYSQGFLKLNHAVGVNPHSLQWRAIYDHLNRHPNVFDMDFSNYDKHLHSELMHGAFSIIRNVIQNVQPDGWDDARAILEEESIRTYVVDYDTIYRTERGNKSGEYLTTVINCICNDILSYYTWIKTTGIEDLTEFRANVAGVSFGDDKIESVSDEFAEKYNYFTAKEVMSSIGHIITPGAKDGVERNFCPIDQAQFLKRGIIEWECLTSAPLLQRSIESPFVWTQIDTSEHSIWYNLVEQTLFEAVLHGPEYYNTFRGKLGKCNDEGLKSAISPLLTVTYEKAVQKYRERYYEIKTHLCTSEK